MDTPGRKRLFMLQNRIVPDVQRKRGQWRDTISGIDPNHLVFLDESGVNLDMTRLYARGPHNQRVTDHVPLNTPTTTTVLSSIRIKKERLRA
ncbi:MAG: transposase [Lachnospiraceae bacterium]|nr:transposase [Lachnospiraceae bacterium]